MATTVRIEEANNPDMNVLFPITPAQVPETGSADVRQFRIIGKGNYSFPDGRGEQAFQVQGYFPGVRRVNAAWDQPSEVPMDQFGKPARGGAVLPHIDVDNWKPPQQLVSRIKDWLERKVRLRYIADTLTGTLNMPVFLNSYTFTRSGGQGDIYYQLQFTEWRTIQITLDDGSPSSGDPNNTDTGGGGDGDQPEAAIPSTYTVKSGDTLSLISKQLLGDSGRWREIYDANADTIGPNPNLIQPGMELTIPGGTVDQQDTDGYDPAGEESTEQTPEDGG